MSIERSTKWMKSYTLSTLKIATYNNKRVEFIVPLRKKRTSKCIFDTASNDVCAFRLGEVNNVFKVRLAGMRKFNEDTVEAYQWLQQNRSMFKGNIYGPIVMSINLVDTRYADIVESALGGERGAHLRVSTVRVAS